MAVYGPATGNYSASSIRLARSKKSASAGDQLKRNKNGTWQFIDNTGGTDNYKNSTDNLRNAILSGSSAKTANVTGGTTSDTSNMIEDMYAQQTKSELAQLKAAIQKGISEQQTVINKAPSTYQPLKNASEVTRYGDLRSALEQSANAGDRGGVGRMAALETQTEADNRLNNLNLQQQGVVDTANQAIADLNTSESTSEAQIKADNAAAKLKALIEQSNAEAAAAAEQSRYEDEQALEYAKLQESIRQSDIENAMRQQELDYTTNKPYYKTTTSSGSSSRSSSGSSMSKDAAYANDYANVENGIISPLEIEANKTALRTQYGIAKYNALLKLAQSNYIAARAAGLRNNVGVADFRILAGEQ